MSGRGLDRPREERFDIYDAAGKPIGTACRSEVHAKGYWHRSFHCWLIRREGDRRLVMFQQRQTDKDTFPGRFDITAAGHLEAGETMREAVREVEEELGVSAAYDMLIPLGETRNEAEGSARGVPFIDREISEVFGLLYDGPPASLRLQAEEVAGVYESELEAMIDLFEGRRRTVTAAGVSLCPEDGLKEASVQVSAADFVTRPYAYYAGVFRALLRHT
ncbi:NUDIX domain-containing protein [Paenibacillus sp. sptzw28]|uniref:NUDIX hydrolase n=1 Tax=Paenibacillus sp. sptzw28 TaxID=715179 RepID=UPI001C6E3BF5|nr:NUDIX domain-containing protein [Paenibacillus sp. sptzw28]QYR21329.1 NUDIX domain-containing protein [Paenibacillus sp. sptzw28]